MLRMCKFWKIGLPCVSLSAMMQGEDILADKRPWIEQLHKVVVTETYADDLLRTGVSSCGFNWMAECPTGYDDDAKKNATSLSKLQGKARARAEKTKMTEWPIHGLGPCKS